MTLPNTMQWPAKNSMPCLNGWGSHLIRTAHLLLLALLLSVTATAQYDGGVEDPHHGITLTGTSGAGELKQNAVAVMDYTVFPAQSTQQSKKIKNIIWFKINEESTKFISADFTATVDLKIEYGPNSGSLTTISSKVFTVNFKKNAGQKYDVNQYFSLDDKEYVRITVNQVTAPVVGTLDTREILSVENEMKITRYFELPASVPAPNSLSHPASPALPLDHLTVSWSWPANTGNNATQLEWVWIENEMQDQYKINGQLNEALMFNNNSTRVDLPLYKTSYAIPMLYDGNGVLYYRIRAVNIKPSGSRSDGPWTTAIPNNAFAFSGHNNDMNWQATTSFAEEGKLKSVIQYFDGSLRQRQTVTKDNSNNIILTAESFYDGQGRPAIQILPTPGMTDVIRYQANLNLFNGQTAGQDPTELFDLQPIATPNSLTPPLSNTTGSSMYYSVQNPDAGTESGKSIPDAEGFPYTVTRYTPDATGRILAQSGVGATHKMGSGQETKYYYGGAAQEELDGLFGTEAGNFTHYFKNMVKDANGQMSVSYVDMLGRTVATALAGEAPANLLPLDKNNAAHYPGQGGTLITRNLLDNGSNIIKGNSLESINTILTPASTLYNFSYTLDAKILQQAACEGQTPAQLCYDCLYDLEIAIVDECGDQDQPVMLRKYTNVSVSGPDDNCSTAQAPIVIVPGNDATAGDISGNSINFSITLPAGSYSIRKTLSISETSLSTYRDLYISKALCKTEQEIIDSIYTVLVNTTDCNNPQPITSQDCLAELGTFTQYRDKYLNSLNIPLANASQELLDLIQKSYDDELAHCALLNPNTSQIIPGIREMMLGDMEPFNGQYAAKLPPASGSATMYYKYNIFATATPANPHQPFYKNPWKGNAKDFYYDDNNEKDQTIHPDLTPGSEYNFLNNTTPDNFALLYKNSWAKSLLPHHPEYPRLLYAESATMQPSYNWMTTFSLTNDWQTALGNGYLSTTVASDPSAADPYFTVVPSQLSDMHVSLGNYGGLGISMWKLAYGDVKCKDIPDATARYNCYQNAPDIFPVGLTGDGEKNQAWQIFRNLYQAERERLTNLHIAAHVPLPGSDEADLVSQGYRLWFPRDNQQVAAQHGWSSWWPNPSPGGPPTGTPTGGGGNTTPTGTYTSRCESYINQWKAQLLKCEALRNHPGKDAILTEITNRMRTVCINGSDQANPWGSSNVAPATPASVTDRNFETVISSVFIQYGIMNPNGIYTDNYCNPFVIEWPKPYGKGPRMTSTGMTNQIDSCNCKQYAVVTQAASAQGVNIHSFSAINQFLKDNQYADTLTIGMFNALKYCDSNIIVTCHTIDSTYEYDSCRGPFPPCYEPQYKNGNGNMSLAGGTPESSLLDCNSLESVAVLFNQQFNNFQADLVVSSRTNNLPPEYVASRSITFMPGFESGVNDRFVAYIDSNYKADCHAAFANFYSAYWNINPPKNWNEVYKIYLAICGRGPKVCEDSSDCLKTMVCQVEVCDTVYVDSFRYILPRPEPFPEFLKCGYEHNKRCVSCANLSVLTAEYKMRFNTPPNAAPLFSASNLTPEQIQHNMNYARFLNYRTGFQFDWLAYSQAAAGATPACNLENYGANGSANQNVICGDAVPLTDTTGLPTDTLCHPTRLISISMGQLIYKLRRQYLLDEFERAYKEKCLASANIETFGVAYQTSEYHYTLYYYDQAGNLVKTVPPAGVRPDFSSTFTNSVKAARETGSFVPRPHVLVTQYRYNSLNQVIAQNSPDGGTSYFWYDKLGRLVVSQNAKQAADNTYSYTLYDNLGRIREVGQKPQTTPMTQTISQDETALNNWIFNGTNNREQITRTTYDQPATNIPAPASSLISQVYLRNRVSFTQYFDTDPDAAGDPFSHASASYYSYDIHGNVDVLLQDYKKGLGDYTCPGASYGANRFKKITYNYDLISGKVNQVNYQPDQADGFYHRYSYDAENRITTVLTSRDKLLWEQDASYTYYKHGPLARTVLGQQKVQGLDYAYTIQGWLKGVNSTAVGDGAYDIGSDGKVGAANANTARDVFGYALNYFVNDYTPIGSNNAFGANSFNLTDLNATHFAKALYNGNIAGMLVNIPKLGDAHYYGYQYDQLNRIRGMNAFTGFSNGSNTWNPTPQPTNNYREQTTYDPNGNIELYSRNGVNGGGNVLAMDDMVYEYIPNSSKLKKVNDYVPAGNYPDDIDNQGAANNYVYDAIGNLVQDNAEGISQIDWTVYGKISRIVKGGKTITYGYDVAGNRISKKVTEGGNSIYTYYVRNAQGNVMSIYEKGTATATALSQTEISLYGSSRLGVYNVNLDIESCGGNLDLTTFTRGNKFFELSNHLGNVLVTVNDRKLATDDGVYEFQCNPGGGCQYVLVSGTPDGLIDYYAADISTANDYYPFGMQMPGRKYLQVNSNYRYSINGQEKEAELNENITTALYWEYDSRIGRRWNVDPVVKESESPYLCFTGNPILLSDPLGNVSGPPDWIKKTNADGSTSYEWNDNAKDPSTTPAGYTYVGPTSNYYAGNNVTVNLYAGGKWFASSGVTMSSGSKGTPPPRQEAPIASSFASRSFKIGPQATVGPAYPQGPANDFEAGARNGVLMVPGGLMAAYCPGCLVVVGAHGIYRGIQQDDPYKIAFGIINTAGGLLGTYARVTSSELSAYGGTRSINPTGGTNNCAGCAIAGNATLNGFPASAINHGVTSTLTVAQELKGTWQIGMNMESISAKMKGMGDGATGIVFGERPFGEVGHFFNVVNKGGTIQFLDFQKSGSAIMQISEVNKFYRLWFLNGTIK